MYRGNLVTEDLIGSHVTIKLRPPKGQRGKWVTVSGVVTDVAQRTFGLERTVYDAWRCTESKHPTTLEQTRVMRVVGYEIDRSRRAR